MKIKSEHVRLQIEKLKGSGAKIPGSPYATPTHCCEPRTRPHETESIFRNRKVKKRLLLQVSMFGRVWGWIV